MSREISLFADYHQPENALTNNTGLVLKLIYEEAPSQFENSLAALLPEGLELKVGPTFKQQGRAISNTPDLQIAQEQWSIYFEVKTSNWFYSDQLNRHINGLVETRSGNRILFCLSNFEKDEPESDFQDTIEKAKNKNIFVQFLSFEKLVEVLHELTLSAGLSKIVDDYADYLDRCGYLPQWRTRLDVVSCRKTMPEIKAGAYICPATGGAYSHRRARYLGTYGDKCTKLIAEIDALILCEANPDSESASVSEQQLSIVWKNADANVESLIPRVLEIASGLDLEHSGHSQLLKSGGLQFFLLGECHETDFRKDTKGGMYGSKKYFHGIADKLGVKNAAELAKELRGRMWSEFS